MCGRYLLNSTPFDLGRYVNVNISDQFPPRFNIAPSQPIAVIVQNLKRRREYSLMRWGFIPAWQKTPMTRPLFNVRAETVSEKTSFRSAYKRRRCLIPANGYYDWREDKKGIRRPFCVKRKYDDLFCFAGIWETATDADGGEIDTAAILTHRAGEDLRADFPRAPVVIGAEHFSIWLETDERDIDILDDLLDPAPPGSWSYFAISDAVNNARHDGPRLIEPLPG